MADRTKKREELIQELVATGAEALAGKVLDLTGQVEKLTSDNETLSKDAGEAKKLRTQKDEFKRVIQAQAEELKAAGILSPSASPIVQIGERYARVRGAAIIEGKSYSAQEIAERPELLKQLVDKKSGLLQFSDDIVKAAEEKKAKEKTK